MSDTDPKTTLSGHEKPTPSGGYIIDRSMPWADYSVEWGPDGKLISESCTIKTPKPPRSAPCVHLGPDSGKKVLCSPCSKKMWGRVNLNLFDCPRHTLCTIGTAAPSFACCLTCTDYEAVETENRQDAKG